MALTSNPLYHEHLHQNLTEVEWYQNKSTKIPHFPCAVMLLVCYMPVFPWPGIHLLSNGAIEINDMVTCCQGWLHFDAALPAHVSLLRPVTSAWTCFTASVSGVTEFDVVWNSLCFSHSNVKLEVEEVRHTVLLHWWLPLWSWIYFVVTDVFLKSET